MKDLKTIATEFSERVQEVSTFYKSKDDYWTYYASIIGFDKEDFFSVDFNEKDDNIKILVNYTTKRPLEIVEIIKDIEPKAKVSFCKEVKTYETITI